MNEWKWEGRMKELPAFLRPGYQLVSSGLVERWIEDCIEFKEGENLATVEYLKSFRDWSGSAYTLRQLNKVLRELGYYLGKVAWVNGRSHRCWVNVRLKEVKKLLVE